jgi:hypothetical protein
MIDKNKIKEEIDLIIQEKSIGFPWLSKAIAEYINLQDNKIPSFLELKKHPALNSSERIKEIGKEKKILIEQLLITRNRLNYYESLFPFLKEYNNENIDDILLELIEETSIKEEEEDPVKKFVTFGEFSNLTERERNQKALDRYLNSTKSPYQIGRDYERYIGFRYEMEGYEVIYHGISEGKEDLGRDLICKKNGNVKIVQCKYWATQKVIHEKHINQLFGTTVKYYIDYFKLKSLNNNSLKFWESFNNGIIKPVFITSSTLSETAKKFADSLGVEVLESEPLKKYPIIKCHINKKTGEKIYHLPFDQMYDRTILEKKHDEFYAYSVEEAELKGFRRAWKWVGDQ